MTKIIPIGAKTEFQSFEGSKSYAQVKKSFDALIYCQGSVSQPFLKAFRSTEKINGPFDKKKSSRYCLHSYIKH